jgi:hypothetical protein
MRIMQVCLAIADIIALVAYVKRFVVVRIKKYMQRLARR